MKKIVNWLLGSVLMIAAVTMLSSVSANASTYYHRTPTRATARKAYYTTDTKSHTFRANGNYNRWTFRANHDLKNYCNTVWTTTQQTDIIMHGKKVRYYWVHNSKNGATGWIWSGYLKPVKAKAATPSEATLVSRMRVSKKAQQIVTVIQNGSSTATLKLWQKTNRGWKNTLTSASRIGAAGIGNSHEGSSTTPKGVYHLSFAFGKAASARTSGMAYRQINRKSYWIEDPHDRQYNTWQNRNWANNKNGHLIDYTKAAPHNQYQLAIVMDNHGQHNGSGFFIHVKNQWATAGCVSINYNDVRTLLSRLGTKAYVVDVQNRAQLQNY
ncbi:L,D-transpeptidase family protein [Lactiplantibacillus plantarum]|uniref:L,D-transpeptidase family protein n=1 Tax=Lactiplantibacillus plantarum TaxID=1590 RepID=UPI001330EB25|nr:L,D-transpeptidase family protein [Lactiplantibacillus plantarum]MDY8144744.1 L,D-transpeptidase family protein [Lactiplantibacillus plantarum]